MKNVIHVRHLLCTTFFGKTACQKYFFQILSQKNVQIVNLKNPDFDLIRRIHPECGFYGFMIRLWICPKKPKIRFWIRKYGFGFSQKKGTHSLWRSLFRFEGSLKINPCENADSMKVAFAGNGDYH